jgi:hypothetical protein
MAARDTGGVDGETSEVMGKNPWNGWAAGAMGAAVLVPERTGGGLGESDRREYETLMDETKGT